MSTAPLPVVLRGEDAVNAMLSLAFPTLLTAWDGTNERVALIEHDEEGNVRATFRSRGDAASELRFRATQAVGDFATRCADGARTLERGAPSGQVHVVIVGPDGCDVGELPAEQLRRPTYGQAPISLPELAGPHPPRRVLLREIDLPPGTVLGVLTIARTRANSVKFTVKHASDAGQKRGRYR